MDRSSVRVRLLPYNDRLDQRRLDAVERVVIHATELPDLATARVYGERIQYTATGTGNSGHFYIDRNGQVEQWVELDRIAHHVAGHNADSLGIELVNLGRYPDWFDSRRQHWSEPVSESQLAALIELLIMLRDELPALRTLCGHDELDQRSVAASDDPEKRVRRKLDPGPDFPWERLGSATDLEVTRLSDDAA